MYSTGRRTGAARGGRCKKRRVAACGVAAALAHGLTCADPYRGEQAAGDADNLQIYVADTVTYDDNIYRLADDFGPARQIGAGASRDDVVNRASLGGSGRLFVERQVFELSGRIDDNRFRENDRLDYTGGEAEAAWNYQLASRISGALGASYSRALGDFAYTRTLEKDMLERQEYFLQTQISVTPRWSLTGEGRTSRVDHSAATAEDERTETDSWKAGVMYATPRLDSFGFDYGESRTRLPDYAPPPGAFGRDYDDKAGAAWLKYAYSVKTRFDVRVGYQRREYAAADGGDFSGTTGRAALHWEPTAKTAVDLSIWRELQAYLEVGSEYFVAHGARLNGVWRPSDRLSFGVGVAAEDHDFRTDAATAAQLSSDREDKLYTGTLSATYAPRDQFSVGLSYQQSRRSSNRALQDYDDHLVAVNVRLQY